MSTGSNRSHAERQRERSRWAHIILPGIGLTASLLPVVLLLILCIFLWGLDTKERADFLLHGPQWPSMLITLMALLVTLVTLWHAVRFNSTSPSRSRWILAIVLLQVVAVIWYWVLQLRTASRGFFGTSSNRSP